MLFAYYHIPFSDCEPIRNQSYSELCTSCFHHWYSRSSVILQFKLYSSPLHAATVAALVSGILSVIATSLIASCIMWCVVLRGRQNRRDTSSGVQQGVHQQESPSTELVEYEVPVLHQQRKDVIITQDNVAYGEKISLQQNVAYEQVQVHQ